MRCHNYSTACQQAQANADFSGRAWVVFSAVSGGWYVERYEPRMKIHKDGTVFHPVSLREALANLAPLQGDTRHDRAAARLEANIKNTHHVIKETKP